MLDPIPVRIPTIVRGQDIVYPIYAGCNQFTGDLWNLSTATEIKAAWLKTDGTIVQKLLSLAQIVLSSNPNLFNVTLAAADTLLFKPSCDYDQWEFGSGTSPIRVEWTIAGATNIMYPAPRCRVVNQLFPGQ